MERKEFEYHGLMAETWDLFRGDTSNWEDRFFFKEMIDKYGQPVLEVCCGTGPLLLDYMAAAIDIDGLELSPDMLALCRQKGASLKFAPRLYLGDMVSMALPRI